MRREREMWATGPTTCQPLAALRRIFFFYLRKPGTDRPSVFPVLPPCDVMSVTNAHWLAWAHRQLRSKTPLLAKNARNGAPQLSPTPYQPSARAPLNFLILSTETARSCMGRMLIGWLGLIVSSSQKPHFSQRTREMGHPAPSRLRDASRTGDVGHRPDNLPTLSRAPPDFLLLSTETGD